MICAKLIIGAVRPGRCRCWDGACSASLASKYRWRLVAVLVDEAVMVLAALGTGVLLALRLTDPVSADAVWSPRSSDCASRASVRSWRAARVRVRPAPRSPRAWPSACSVASDRTSRSACWHVQGRSRRGLRGLLGRNDRRGLLSRRCRLDAAAGARGPAGATRFGAARARWRAPTARQAAGPLSPFWRALMAATRSPLRILAVPLMPMLEASPWEPLPTAWR